jgi:hypothetical protein
MLRNMTDKQRQRIPADCGEVTTQEPKFDSRALAAVLRAKGSKD